MMPRLQLKLTPKIHRMIKLCSFIALLSSAPIVMAAESGSDAATKDLSAVSNKVIAQAQGIGQLVTIASYVAGVAMTTAAILQFKAHKENPTQTPLSKPVTLLCVGGGLLFLPTVTRLAGGSLFGTSEGNAGNNQSALFSAAPSSPSK